MFIRIVLLLFIFGCYSLNCLVPVPPIYRKAELGLRRYLSHSSYNPIIYSLLNVLIHDKQGRAFISDQAIEMALKEIKELDQNTKTNNEKFLRQLIYGINCKRNGNNCLTSYKQKIVRPTPDLKQRIGSALDKFFDIENLDGEEWPMLMQNDTKQ